MFEDPQSMIGKIIESRCDLCYASNDYTDYNEQDDCEYPEGSLFLVVGIQHKGRDKYYVLKPLDIGFENLRGNKRKNLNKSLVWCGCLYVGDIPLCYDNFSIVS